MRPELDLIVVGAGSAGCVIASRVAEQGRRVLLIEAGPDYSAHHALPTDLRNGNNNSYTAHDWGFSYLPQSQARPQPFPRGRVVGGSSAVNTCIALRGEPADYDEWAARAGDEWSWEQCREAFVRLETDIDFADRPYHGSSGPLRLRRYPADELEPIQTAFLDACSTLCYPRCPDHNDPGSTGAGPTPMNKDGSERISVASAYLHPDRRPPGLQILAETLVRRVVVSGRQVRGVEIVRNGAAQVIDCPNIVLSAGAIMTPPLLVRSGIGPKTALRRLGIEPVSVLEGVGARLLDHPGTILLLQCKTELADTTAPLVQACMRTSLRERNDLFIEPLTFVGRGNGLAGIAVAAYRSYGAGRLEFGSLDPDAPPRIEARYFEDDDRDLELLVDGLRIAVHLAQTEPLRELAPDVVGLSQDVLDDDVRLREHIRRFSGSGYHPCGTAPMGHPEDPQAVCDSHGRVFGVKGLRIADASIMPVVPRANINIPTIMIGERFGAWLSAELSS